MASLNRSFWPQHRGPCFPFQREPRTTRHMFRSGSISHSATDLMAQTAQTISTYWRSSISSASNRECENVGSRRESERAVAYVLAGFGIISKNRGATVRPDKIPSQSVVRVHNKEHKVIPGEVVGVFWVGNARQLAESRYDAIQNSSRGNHVSVH